MKNKNYSKSWSLKFALIALIVWCISIGSSTAQVTVNPGSGSYASISAAFTAINAGTHTGTITIAISGNTTEPAAPTVLAASGVGAASYTSIAIYPTASGVVVTGPTNVSRGVLEFNGADNITINGNLNNGSGTSRDLTIKNTTAAVTNAHSVLWFQGTATSPALGCTNIVIKNTILQGNGNSGGASGTTTYSTGIAFAGTTFPSSTTLGANHQNITITNNQVKQVGTGIHIGNASGTPVLNLQIDNNEIGSATASEYVYYRGMWLSNISGSLIKQNHVYNIKPSLLTQSTDRMGIEIAGTSASVTIDRNNIHAIATYGTGGYAGYGINLNGGNNHLVTNNIIYDIEGYSWSSQIDCPEGIRLSAGTGHKVYYNSVHLFGQVTGTGTRYSSAFVVASTSVTGIDVRNNIFSNKMTNPNTTTCENMAMWFIAAYPFSTANNTINNNALFVSPSSPNHFIGKVGTTLGSSTYQTLSAWQTVSLGDAQSIPIVNMVAPFTSNTNLTIPASTSTGCESGGVAIASLGIPNIDYTGVNRPAGTGTAPDMGAYEFDGVAATGCTGTPSSGGTASTISGSICAGNSAIMSATGYTSDIGIQYNWQSSSAFAGPFTDISGANTPSTYTSGNLSSDTYFRLRVTCSNSTLSNYSNVVTITVNNPQISSTTPNTRCGTGTVVLSATPSSGTINWYANPTGGLPIGTGNTFTTPTISTTTTYYAAASSGGTTQTSSNGVPNVTTSTQNGGVIFDLNTNVTINSIQVYSTAAGTATVTLMNSALTTLFTSSAMPITAGTLSTPQTLNLGWSVPAGTGYRILVANTGNALGYSSGAFPAPMGNGVGTIVNGALNTSTSTLNYFVYNINTTSGCESNPRTAVTATVQTAPTINVSANQNTICNGATVNLSVNSPNDPNYVYTWTSTPAGYNNTGSSVTANPTVSTVYNVAANDNSTGCQALSSVSVIALPASPTVSGSPSSICGSSGTTVMSLTPSTGYGAGTIQWASSSDGITYTPIGGANAVTYSTPTLTSTIYYQATIKDDANNVCSTPFQSIVVGVPTVNTTTNGSRCGIGSATLEATGSAGSTIKWYTSSTGGMPIGSGSPFSTPVINATTTYYAAAETGSGSPTNATVGAGATTSATYSNPFYSLWSNLHNQHLILASELYAAGMSAGIITAGAINITSAGTLPMIDFSIKMANTNATNLSSYVSPSFTTVYTSPSLMPILGLNGITFTTPFVWDGVSNVVIEICHGNPSSTATMSRTCTMEATSFISTIHTHKTVATGGSSQCGDNATNVTTYSTRPQFYFTYLPSCSSNRVAVTATVNASPSLTVTANDIDLCPGGSTSISVTSPNDPSYTYNWTSSPSGFTASGAGPHTISPSSVTKYYVNAIDNTAGPNAGCAALDSVTINTAPVLTGGTVSAPQVQFCVSGSTTLTVAGDAGGTRQWQSSTVSSSGPWTNVGTGATTLSTGTLNQTTYYRVIVTCQSTTTASSNVLTLTVNTPQVLSTTPGSRCGYGSVALSANISGVDANWYANASGGTAIGTGTTFNTPNINNTTTYYVAANSGGGGTSTVGAPNLSIGTFATWSSTAQWLNFTVLSTTTIQSVDMFFSSAVGTPFSIVIRDAVSLANVFTYNGTVSVTSTSIADVIPISATLNPGTYQMNIGSSSATTYRNSTGGVYPYTVPGVISITGNTFDQTYYYMFYRWQVATGCESARTAVTATVNPSPTIFVASTFPAVCTGGSTDLSVTSGNDPDYTYSWSSSPAGFTATGAGPFTVSPTVTTKYYVLATDNSGNSNAGCAYLDSITVVAGGTLAGGAITTNIDQHCVSGTSTLTLNGASGGFIQWQKSTVSSSGPWTNTGSGITTLNTGVLTQTTYYQAVVSCQLSSANSNVQTVTVNNPQLSSTSGAVRCGPGQVTLNATASSGTVLWYTTPTGGTSIATGNTYSPTVTNTTTYYAAASSGGGVSSMGLPNRVGATTNSGYSDVGLMFDALQSFTLNSVAIYPVATTPSGNVTFTIALKNSAGTILQSTTASVPTSASPGVKTVIPLNFVVPAGTQNRLVFTSASGGGITGFIREITTGFTYPYTLPGVASITSAYTGGASASYYYYFYDWQIATGCEGARTGVVATVTPSPAVTVSSNVTTICAGQSAVLHATSSNPGYTYTWNPGNLTGSTVSVTPSANTTYNMTAIDNTTQCGAIGSITINSSAGLPPQALATSNAPICEGNTLNLAGSNLQSGQSSGNFYSWSGPGSYFSTQQTPAINNATASLNSGTYSLVVTNSFGCKDSMQLSVPVNSNPIMTITTNGVSCSGLCDGDATITVANGQAPFLFYDGINFSNDGIYVDEYCAGPQSVDVFDDNGCTSTTTFNIGTISTAPPSSSLFIPAGSFPASGCVGQTVNVVCNTVPGATEYKWSVNSGTMINGQNGSATTTTPNATLTLGAIPANVSNWEICVFAQNGCGVTNTKCFSIRGNLSTPAPITGSTVACPNTSGTYSIPAVGGAEAYQWTGTNGITFTGSGTTVTANFPAGFTSGTICVAGKLNCGYTGPTRCITVSNSSPNLGAMSGPFSLCPGAINQVFSVPAAAGAASYTWSVPANVSIVSGQGTPSLTVNVGAGFVTGNICVYATSNCGVQTALRCKTMSSTQPLTPGNITGQSAGVCGQTITYSVPAVSGVSSYNWSVTGAGASISSSNGSNTIDVTYSGGFTTGTVCVVASNACGNSASRCINVKGAPADPGTISGPTSVCAFESGVNFSIPAVQGATNYVWTVPSGAAIMFGAGTNSIIVDWGSASGSVTVRATNGCGTSGTKSISVIVGCKVSGTALPGVEVSAYPNPVRNLLTVELNAIHSGNYTIELSDVSGRVIYSHVVEAISGMNNSTIDVSKYNSGIYMLTVKNAEGFMQQLRVAVE